MFLMKILTIRSLFHPNNSLEYILVIMGTFHVLGK